MELSRIGMRSEARPPSRIKVMPIEFRRTGLAAAPSP